MKKLLYCFNWLMFLVLIVSLSSLNAPSWKAEIVAVVSALALASGASMLEQIKVRDGK